MMRPDDPKQNSQQNQEQQDSEPNAAPNAAQTNETRRRAAASAQTEQRLSGLPSVGSEHAPSELEESEQADIAQGEREQVGPAMARHSMAVEAVPLMQAQQAVGFAPADVCERLRPELKAYVDGQAGWWQRQSIGRHLTRCADCREETAAMRQFSVKWRRADDDVLDPNLRARILAAVPDTPPALTRVTAPSRPPRRTLALAGAGASAVIGAALLFPIWQRGARVGSEDAAKTYPGASNAVTSASSPATVNSAGQTTNGAAANPAAPPAPERNVAASSALPPKTKATQIADARTYGLDKNDGATVAAEASGAGPSGRMAQDAAGGIAAAPVPPLPAASAKSAAQPTAAAPSVSGSANVPPAPKAAAAADNIAREASHPGNKADEPAVNSNSDKSERDSYAAKSKLPTDANERSKHAVPQAAQEAAQMGTAAMAHRVGHPPAPGGKVTPAAPQLAASRPALTRAPASSVYGRAMTPDDAADVLLKISVAHIETATASIERDIRTVGGSVLNSAMQTDPDGVKSATILLKAPAASLNAFLARAEQTGTLLSKSVPPVLPSPPVIADASAADVAKRRTNAPAPKEGRGQKAYTNVTIRLLNREMTR